MQLTWPALRTSFSLLAPRLSCFFLTVSLDHSQNQKSDLRTVILIQLLNKMHVNYIFENDDNISWSKTTFIKFYNYLCFFALLCFNKMFVEYLFLEYLFASSDLFWRQKQPTEVFWKKRCAWNFANFKAKQLLWSLLVIKLQAF